MRPTIDEYFLDMARLASRRSTCARRSVGCILVDNRDRVLSTGYNGVASGCIHCTDRPCPGAICAPGHGLNLCEAIHAETNAIINCRDPQDIHRAYVTASPCIYCTRQLLNTSCNEIIYEEEYPHQEAGILWRSQRRIWRQFQRK